MKLFTILTCFYVLAIQKCENKFSFSTAISNIMKPKIFNTIDEILKGTQCGDDIKKFITDLFHLKWWAIRMFDASSKLHPGFFNGNYRLYGNYDQCLDVIKNWPSGRIIKGQYCTVSVATSVNTTKAFFNMITNLAKHKGTGRMIDLKYFVKYAKAFFGLCLPKSCSIENLNKLWNHIQQVFHVPIEAKFLKESCVHTETKLRPNQIDTYVFYFFGIILIIVLASTAYDIYLQSRAKTPNIFVSFSLFTNTKRLFSTDCENSSLTCLYGIRVFSMAWIIFGHIALTQMFSSNTNTLYVVTEWKNRFESAFILAAPYAVDTFFSISGLLVVYVHLKYSEKMKISLLAFYLHRIIRLVPALIATILIYISLFKYLSEGPIWPFIVKKVQKTCEHTWFATLLFFSNYFNFNIQCIQQSWYLSMDTQLYVMVAPIILFSLRRNVSKTFIGITTLCLVSLLYTFFVVVYYNIGFVVFWELDDTDSNLTYFNTLSRMPSWLIGTVFGYLIYQQNHKKIYIPKTINLLLWTLSLSLMLNFILYHVVFMGYQYSVLHSAFFNSCSRLLWSLAVSFIIFSCSTGHGGFINRFLSHPIFIVLGKLTYSMYLTHAAVILIVTGNQRHSGYFNNFGVFCDFCSNYVIILICSSLMCLIFETPFISMLKHLDKQRSVFRNMSNKIK